MSKEKNSKERETEDRSREKSKKRQSTKERNRLWEDLGVDYNHYNWRDVSMRRFRNYEIEHSTFGSVFTKHFNRF